MFRKEFTTDNVMGVYLPYMIVDANTHANLKGQGEHETRRWTEKMGIVMIHTMMRIYMM